MKKTDYNICLTQYSHNPECACKISPAAMDVILKTKLAPLLDKALLLENSSRNVAKVNNQGNGSQCLYKS